MGVEELQVFCCEVKKGSTLITLETGRLRVGAQRRVKVFFVEVLFVVRGSIEGRRLDRRAIVQNLELNQS